MPLVMDKYFSNGWVTRTSGSGAVTITDGVLNSTGSGTDTAMKDYWLPVTPGQVVEFSCLARNNGDEARIAIDNIDYAGNFANLDWINVTASEFRRYRLRCVVPYDSSYGWVRVVLGKWGSMSVSHDADYTDPVVAVSNGFGTTSVIALGLIRLQSGTVDLHPTFRSYNIDSVSFNGTYTVTVTLKTPCYASMRPLVFVSSTPDSCYIPQAGSFSAGDPTAFIVKWTDGAAVINVSAVTSLYAFVKVEL
ncbi:MAG: hypothetical protein H6Q73_2991 [Firmicutes bacterium]|nr:hypothetical protein [Bacillota bacterium]